MIDTEALRVQPELTGGTVVLAQLDETYFEPAWQALQEPETTRLTGTHTKFTENQIRKWLASRPGLEDRADYAILRKEDRGYLGDVVLSDIDEDNRSAAFRIALTGPDTRLCDARGQAVTPGLLPATSASEHLGWGETKEYQWTI